MRIKAGEYITDFEFISQYNEKLHLSDIFEKNKNTLLVFLRYYGCPVCQLDLKEYREKYQTLKETETELIIVLQSTPESIRDQGGAFEFLIACDPEKKMYQELDIRAAKSMIGMLSFKTIAKVKRTKQEGIEHGEYEGEELQLPAAFLIDKTGKVIFSHYAKNLGDMPSPEDFIQMVGERTLE
jgi:thioredoxin-dependent peroxiredoxin